MKNVEQGLLKKCKKQREICLSRCIKGKESEREREEIKGEREREREREREYQINSVYSRFKSNVNILKDFMILKANI